MDLSRGGARTRSGEQSLSMRLSALGRDGRLLPVPVMSPRAHANRVVYAHAGVAESYAAGPLGIEQGFTLARRPTGNGSLTLAIALRGSLHAVRARGRLDLLGPGSQPVLRYGGLSASDAARRHLPAWLELSRGLLLIQVADVGARYPLHIDPLIEQGEELTPNDESNKGQFGYSVALSSNGDTALIGGRGDGDQIGAAWIFSRSGSTWTQQGTKLTGGGEVGKGEFGSSVALSADGSTALIGAPGDAGQVGAVWIFSRSGSTWTQQGAKLTGGGEVGEGQFGAGVGLSSDADTALIGAPYDYGSAGAAWVFARSGSRWTQQGEKLTANDESEREESLLGWSVALSANGDTALIGGWGDNDFSGAAWVFVRSGSTWTQQGAKLTGRGGDRAWFGFSVALASTGDTALVGGPGNLGGTTQIGAAWVFTRSGSAWTQQGEKLSPPPENQTPEFGYGVALSANGDIALIGGPTAGERYGAGAAWVFARSASTWIQQGSKLSGASSSTSANLFGLTVALSADGSAALIGGPFTSGSEGAAWVFLASPQISGPASVSFAFQPVGRPGTVLWLEVKNAGAAPLSALSFSGPAQITGPDASEFTIPSGDDRCAGETLQPGQACRIGVQFRAATTGSSRATLTFGANNSLSAPPTVALSGTGVQSPTASFTSPDDAIAGTPITFNASASSAPDGAIEHYAWNFGDGTMGAGVTPHHSYAASGTYAVTLTVTDNDGLTSQTTHSTIVNEAQTIELLSSAPTSAEVGGPSYAVSAVASSGLPVVFASETPETCRAEGTTVSFIGPGICTIKANQPGNAEYGAAPEVQQSMAVAKGSQRMRFTSSLPASATVGGPTSTVSATASSGLAVSLSSETPGVCSLEGSTVSFIAVGTCTIDADQAGSAAYDTAPRTQQSVGVRSPVISQATPTAGSSGGFRLSGKPTSSKRGALTFTVSAPGSGIVRWLLTFPGGLSPRGCRATHSGAKRRCGRQQRLYSRGTIPISTAGAVSFTIRPTGPAKAALANALMHHQRLQITASIRYEANAEAGPLPHTQTTDRIGLSVPSDPREYHATAPH
jgi:PKD repeat protein